MRLYKKAILLDECKDPRYYGTKLLSECPNWIELRKTDPDECNTSKFYGGFYRSSTAAKPNHNGQIAIFTKSGVELSGIVVVHALKVPGRNFIAAYLLLDE